MQVQRPLPNLLPMSPMCRPSRDIKSTDLAYGPWKACSAEKAQLEPWLEAAQNFELNTDFDIEGHLPQESIQLPDLMAIMKAQSAGKRTIQALGDKILLHRLLSNLGVVQMPMLLAMHGSIDAGQVDRLVNSLEQSGEEDAFDLVAKPTHLSNSAGTLMLSTRVWRSHQYDAKQLRDHMEYYMAEKAHETESAALQSLIPGFVVQPRYRSCFDFGVPIEIRVITLWGRTRLGIWWWGPKGHEKWERNAWLVPASGQRGEVENWQVLSAAPSRNASHNAALQLVLQSMPTMARAAEKIARATGAPILRSDFFVGSQKWGIRLNEVAYGSNIELRRMANNALGYADDSQAIAQILLEGFKHCKRKSPENFLSRLGAQGTAYEPAWWKFWGHKAPGMEVAELPATRPVPMASTQTSSALLSVALKSGSAQQGAPCVHPPTSLPGKSLCVHGSLAAPVGFPSMGGYSSLVAVPTPARLSGKLPLRAQALPVEEQQESSVIETARLFMQRVTVGNLWDRSSETPPTSPRLDTRGAATSETVSTASKLGMNSVPFMQRSTSGALGPSTARTHIRTSSAQQLRPGAGPSRQGVQVMAGTSRRGNATPAPPAFGAAAMGMQASWVTQKAAQHSRGT